MSALQAAETPRPVGVARVDITPDYPTRLTGFAMRKTESAGVAQKIWAKALAFGSDADGPAVLVTVDNLGVSDAMRSELLRRLSSKSRLTHDRLAICSSHTHSAPMINGVAPNIFSADLPPDQQARIDRYTRDLTDNLEKVILAALADRQPAQLAWAGGKAGFAINRRARPIAPVDHDLPVLRVTSPEGRVRALFISYACHCVTLSLNTIHGDWSGSAQLALEADQPGAIALVAIGCGADQNPDPRGTPEMADAQGRQIAEEVKRLFTGPWKPLAAPLAAQAKRIELPFEKLPTRAEWAALATNTAPQISFHAKKNLARLDRGETIPTALPYLVQVWNFGRDLAMVFLPGEVVVDYSLRLKKEFDPGRLWVNGYANDAACYIPSERILAEGGYEGGGAMVYYDRPTRFAVGVEARIVNAVRDLMPGEFLPARTQMPRPKTPLESLASIQTRPGFVVELVAAEPLIVDPVAIDFGADGTLWVAEMHDYPTGLDGNWKPGGRVKVLTSSQGDGRYDRAAIFLDGIPFPTGVMAWRRGALICTAPDILYAEDTDGDGRADVVRKVFSGFVTDNYQARVNSLSLGLDNWVHGANGLRGGVISGVAGGREVSISGRDFRLHPDSGAFEPVSGLTQQGRARDDWGNWFGNNNSQLALHFPLPDHYLRRNPHIVAPAPSVFIPADPDASRLFPVSDPLERFNHPESLNQATSVCGLGVYRDTLLGAGFSQNLFVCESVHNLVRRLVPKPSGVTFAGLKAPDEQASEFLASTDNWFRPAQALTGPDGALWVVDMYRLVIEHPRWIPPERLKELDVRAGADRGRIYRVYPKGAKLRPPRDFTRLPTPELVAALNTANGVQRDLAHRELLHRSEAAARTPLADLFQKSESPAVRLQALAALAGVSGQAVATDALLRALADPHPAVRRHGIRLAEPLFPHTPSLATALLALVNDPDPTVRYQIAFTLGTWSDPRATDALVKLLPGAMADAYQRAAVLSGAGGRTAGLLAMALNSPPTTPGRGETVGALIATAAATAQENEFGAILSALAPATGQRTKPWQLAAMITLQDAFEARRIALTTFAKSPHAETRVAAERLKQIFDDARHFAVNPEVAESTRRLALDLLGRGFNRVADDAPLVTGLLAPAASPAMQQAALGLLGRRRWAGTDDMLLSRWAGLPIALRSGAAEVLAGREDWTQSLLDAVERGVVASGEVPVSARQRFHWHGSDATKARVAKLFPEQSASRAAVMERYQSVALLRGDRTRGREVFTKNCATCHAYRGEGHALGPDLATFRTKSLHDFLIAILDPNAAVEPKFVAYHLETRDDRSLSGIVLEETATSLTLAQAGGVRETLLRAAIKELKPSRLSLMPEGIEGVISPQDMADLVAWLRE